MRFTPSIFSSLLKAIDRRGFKAIVEKHAADAYDKKFRSWDHLVALVFAQLSGASSLRAIEEAFNAQSNHHYHLGCGRLARSSLADANHRRPPQVFAELLGRLTSGLGRKMRAQAEQTLRLIDSTPIPLGALFDCAAFNGRIRGLKLHVLYAPQDDCPLHTDVTPANVNDIGFGRALTIQKGATYVFDKAYCHFGWWTQIDAAGAVFVTRPKKNMRWKTLRRREIGQAQGDGFQVKGDREVRLASKGDSKLPIFLRRITIKRETGEVFDIVTNDARRPARELAACYKARWAIELFFRWIKQNLNVKAFIGLSENAIRLQILAALIAHVLLVLARNATRTSLTPRRFVELVGSFLHARRPLAAIEKPPPVNPARAKPADPNQLKLAYL